MYISCPQEIYANMEVMFLIMGGELFKPKNIT